MLRKYFEKKLQKLFNVVTIFVVRLNKHEEMVEAANFNGSLAEIKSSKRVPILLPRHSNRTFKARMQSAIFWLIYDDKFLFDKPALERNLYHGLWFTKRSQPLSIQQ